MRVLPVVVLSLPLAGPAWAEVVTEQEFLAGIGERHPALAVAVQPLVEAEAALQRARVLSNPLFEATREDPQELARQTTLTLSWVPPIDGGRGLGIRAAEAGVSAAEKQVAVARLRLQVEAKAVYAEWSAASELQCVLVEQVRGLSELARRVRARAEAGEESALAAGRLDLAAADVEAELRSAEAARILAGAAARAWRPDLAADATAELPAISPSQDEVPSLVLDALEREAEQARLRERLAGRFWTAPALQVGWQRQHHDDASGPVFGLSWTVPLFDRNQAERHEAERRREAAETRVVWATARIAAAVEGRRQVLDVRRRAAVEAERAAAQAPPVLRAATARFEAGEGTVTELVEAIAAARSAERRAVEARAQGLDAERALIATMAGLPEGEIR